MPRYFENTTLFHFTWDQVAQAFWKKYPNPHSGHVLSEDTIQREVRAGRLFTKRLLTKTNSSIPKFADRFITSKCVSIVEESICDAKNKVLITYTRNLGYTRVMSVIEKVVYRESEENPGHTIAIRSAWIDSQISGFSRAICAFGIDRFRKNCTKMVGGFNYVLSNMFPNQTTANTLILNTLSATSKIKDAAKNASELAKAKAAPIYATLQANKS